MDLWTHGCTWYPTLASRFALDGSHWHVGCAQGGDVDVPCSHGSRGIRSGSHFHGLDVTTNTRACNRMHVSEQHRHTSYVNKCCMHVNGGSRMWQVVSGYTSSMRATASFRSRQGKQHSTLPSTLVLPSSHWGERCRRKWHDHLHTRSACGMYQTAGSLQTQKCMWHVPDGRFSADAKAIGAGCCEGVARVVVALPPLTTITAARGTGTRCTEVNQSRKVTAPGVIRTDNCVNGNLRDLRDRSGVAARR